MASNILHIKDSYYFEIPKYLLPRHYTDKSQFPVVWIKLDDQYQDWEFARLYEELTVLAKESKVVLPSEEHLHHEWHKWQHTGHLNHGKPFDVYLEEHADKLIAGYRAWVEKKDNADKSFDDYLKTAGHDGEDFGWFAKLYQEAGWKTGAWAQAKQEAGDVKQFNANESIKWSDEKLKFYNHHLSGKILIPQPLGELRNLYEGEPGSIVISKFMIIEVVVSLIMLALFSWVAGKIASGLPPKGRLWNLLETFLVFVRDQVAVPAIGGDHHDEHDHAIEHDAHGMALAVGTGGMHADAGEELSPRHDGHGHHKTKGEIKDEKLFTPILWTIFFFVLGCNLFGIAPWAGSPTASFNVTLALAFITFLCVVLGGMRKFGFLGFFANQVPSMDLPTPIAIVIKPMIFAIEIGGLLIKHSILAIRLLANMVAGHLVILGLMGLAFGVTAALQFEHADTPAWLWPLVSGIAVIAATLFNVLELFVAFLQAYIFTFLSALFIGAAVHKH